jgi:hypothetical protein
MKLDDKSEPMILVGYHKTGVYRLFNPINEKIVMSRDIVIDENSAWDWNSSNVINKPLMTYDFSEASNDVEVKYIVDIPVEVEVVADIPDTVEVREVMARRSQRPQRTKAPSARFQDYEVVGDDEVITDGVLVHFASLASDEPINSIEALKNIKWKSSMVEELQVIERNNAWELVELPTHKSYRSEVGVQVEAQC